MTTGNRDATIPKGRQSRLPVYLFGAYAAFWAAMAVAPLHRFDWFLENLLVFATVPFLILQYRRQPLSDASYVLIFLFYCLHTLGAHYTYSEVPAGFWVSDLLGIERNHYDRAVHFSFGLLLCYPLQEVVARVMQPRGNWALGVAVLIVCTCSLAYETIEWIVAAIVSPEAALAFLGTQGDVFDAQKDSALAAVGSIISASAVFCIRKRQTA